MSRVSDYEDALKLVETNRMLIEMHNSSTSDSIDTKVVPGNPSNITLNVGSHYIYLNKKSAKVAIKMLSVIFDLGVRMENE